MAYALRFHRTGGPEVLTREQVEVGRPGPGEARIRHRAIGLNVPAILAQKGSLYLTRPTLKTYADRPADLLDMSRSLFDVVLSGAVKVEIGQTYALRDAAEAHHDLQARKTTGPTVLGV